MSEAQKELTSQTPQSVIQGEQGLDAAQIGISVFIIAALTFLAYFNTFNIPLHGPDQLLFAESKALHHITSTPQALPQQPYAPLTLLSWACNWRIAPFHIDLMHGGNLLFQILNSISLYFPVSRTFTTQGPRSGQYAVRPSLCGKSPRSVHR